MDNEELPQDTVMDDADAEAPRAKCPDGTEIERPEPDEGGRVAAQPEPEINDEQLRELQQNSRLGKVLFQVRKLSIPSYSTCQTPTVSLMHAWPRTRHYPQDSKRIVDLLLGLPKGKRPHESLLVWEKRSGSFYMINLFDINKP